VFVCYLDDSVPYIRCWDLSGQPHKGIVIPTDGTIRLLPNHNEEDTLFYTYESYALPPVIFEYSPGDGRSEIWHSREPVINQKSFAIRQSTYLSKDGVEIPITLVGGDHVHPGHPGFVIMTSYGGFGIPSMPQFSALVTIMLEQGVVFALPHIRGGGEFGKTWHDAGRGRNRQASFDDFLAAAEWLCVEGITTPEKLGIFGGSNSGLLVGAAMTQRPELFRAVLCIAPLLDMVRYETFDQAAKWRYEYGTAREARDFHSLYAYSPYHHVDDGVDYPPTLFVSGDKDDRCNPAHLRKMAARLLGRSAQTNAIVVDYSDQRGHSPVLPLSVRTEALARRVAFLCHELGICPKEVLHETTCT
jgi:prolyl oligopeptidase